MSAFRRIVGDFERILKAHAPDEWLSVENFEKGLRTVAVLWEELGRG